MSRWLARIETHHSPAFVPIERSPTCSGTWETWAAAGQGWNSVAGSLGACCGLSRPSPPLHRVPSSTRIDWSWSHSQATP
eukprot:2423693-Prymnesium_polylepis.1